MAGPLLSSPPRFNVSTIEDRTQWEDLAGPMLLIKVCDYGPGGLGLDGRVGTGYNFGYKHGCS
jgi:hypothetical protein